MKLHAPIIRRGWLDDLAEWLLTYPTRRVRLLAAIQRRGALAWTRERRWAELARAERDVDNATRALDLAARAYRVACQKFDARRRTLAEAEAECRRVRANIGRRTAP